MDVGDKILGPLSRENCKERKKKETIDWSLEPGDEHVMRMPQVERYLPLIDSNYWFPHSGVKSNEYI